jgi:hypothetical protein
VIPNVAADEFNSRIQSGQRLSGNRVYLLAEIVNNPYLIAFACQFIGRVVPYKTGASCNQHFFQHFKVLFQI